MNVTLYTDASFNHKDRTGGWAAWFKTSEQSGLVGGPLRMEGPGDHSSSTCELAAIANGVHVVVKRGVLKAGDRLVVVTDSTVAIAAIEKCQAAGPKAHRDLRDAPAHYIVKAVKAAGATLALHHVKAHQNRHGCRRSYVNALVDAEASKWRRLAECRMPRPISEPLGVPALPASFSSL